MARTTRGAFSGAGILASLALALAGCSGSKPEPPAAPAAKSVSVPVAKPETVTLPPAVTASPASPTAPVPRAADLESTGPRVIVSGRITLTGGAPGAGAAITVRQPQTVGAIGRPSAAPDGVTTAGADGRYRLELPDTGNLLVTARLAGYAPRAEYAYSQGGAWNAVASRAAAVDSETSAGPVQPARTVREASLDLALEPAAAVSGRVLGPDGRPFPGATVRYVANSRGGQTTLAESATSSTAGGAFSFRELSAGSGTLVAHDPSGQLAAASKSTSAPCDSEVLRFAGEGGRVEGNVFRLETGAAVAGAKVTMTVSGGLLAPMTTATDELGAFTFDHVPGDAMLRLSAIKGDELRMAPPAIGLPRAPEAVVKDGETTSGLTLTLYGGHAVSGTVTDKSTSAPLAGVDVRVANANDVKSATARSGPDGRFRLYPVFPTWDDVANLLAEKPGYTQADIDTGMGRHASAKLTAKNLEATRDLRMEPAVKVTVTARTEGGGPVAGAAVSLVADDVGRGTIAATPPPTRTGKDGRATLTTARYSRFVVKVDAAGYPLAFSDGINADDRDRSVEVVVKRGASVSGRVVGPAGAPVAGAKVAATANLQALRYAQSVPLGDIVSGSNGTFALSGLMPGVVQINAKLRGFADAKPETARLEPGATKADVEMKLRAGHFLGGQVTGKDRQPISGATVYCNGSDNDASHANGKTGADGRYRLEDLAEAAHWVGVTLQEGGNGRILGQANRTVATVDRDDIDFALGLDKPKGELTGRVIDEATGDPIPVFDVRIDYNTAGPVRKGVPAPGSFTAEIEEGSYYKVTVTAEGYQPLAEDGTLLESDRPRRVEKIYRLGRGGTITGRTVERDTDKPLPGVRVLLMWGGDEWNAGPAPADTAMTDMEGRFRFAGVAAGERRVRFVPDSPRAEQQRTATVANGKTASLGDVELGGGGVIRGKVVRGRDGADTPVPGAVVDLTGRPEGGMENLKRSAKTDDYGAFSFDALPPQRYGVELAAESAGAIPISCSNEVADGQTVEVILRIGGGTIHGTVLRKGAPVPGAQINAQPEAGTGSLSSTSNAKGQYALKALPAGKWFVSAYVFTAADGSNSRGTEVVELPDGGDVTRDLVLASGIVKVVVVDRAGKPVQGAQVGLARTDGGDPKLNQGRTQSTGSAGTITFQMIAPGRYRATAAKSGSGVSRGTDVTLPPDAPAPVEVKLTLGSADADSGTVVTTALNMADGQPVVGAWCKLWAGGPDGEPFLHAATRESDGTMTIEGVPAGTYTIETSFWGFSAARHDGVAVKAGETVRFDDVLYDAGSFDWKLTDGSGQPLAAVECPFDPADATSIESPRSGRTDAKGLWSIRGLAPGRYTATATPAGRAPLSEQVTIVAKQGAERTTKVE